MRYQPWFFAILLCCTPVLVVAAPPDLLSGTDTQNDASLYYLGLIFGNVGTVLQGSGTMVVGSIFKIYNAVILSLGLVTVLYTILLSTLQTAQEGEMMGKKFSSLWIPLKAGLGISLVTPLASGYCLFQMMTLWIILQGVGAANQLWGSVLDNALQGNSLKPAEPTFEIKWNDPTDTDMNVYKETAKNVFNGLACMYAYQRAQETIEKKNNEPADTSLSMGIAGSPDAGGPVGFGVAPADPLSASPIPLPLDGKTMDIAPYIADAMANETAIAEPTMRLAIGIQGDRNHATVCGVQENQSYNIAGVKGNTNTTGSAEKSGAIAAGVAAGAAIAGPVGAIGALAIGGGAELGTRTYKPANSYVDTKVNKIRPELNQAHAMALLEMAQVMQNSAKDAVYSELKEWTVPPGFYKEAVKAYFNTLQAKSFISVDGSPVPMDEFLPELPSDSADRLAHARQGGWLYAGSYYFNLLYPPNSKKRIPTPAHKFEVKNQINFIDNLSNNDPNYAIASKISIAGITAPLPLTNATSLYIAQSIRPESSPIEKMTPKENPRRTGNNVFIDAIRDSLMSNVMTTIRSITRAHGLDPMMSMSIWGTELMVDTEIAFFAVLAVFIPLAVVAGVMASANPGFAAVLNAVMTLAPIILMIITTLWAAGALIAIYLPMIPYLLFFFSSIGWFLAVIEAVIAAPLIGLGLTSPSQEHLGKAAPAIMLITNVFLRPSLMVLGFIIAGRLFIIGVDMMYFSFEAAIRTQIADLTAFGAILVIVLFVSLALSIANKSFALIHVLPDRVLRWIGGQVEHWGQEAGQSVQQVQGEFKQAADATAKTMGELGKSAIAAAQAAGDKAGKAAAGGETGGADKGAGAPAPGGGAGGPGDAGGDAGGGAGGALSGGGQDKSKGGLAGMASTSLSGGGNDSDDNDSDTSSSSGGGGAGSSSGGGSKKKKDDGGDALKAMEDAKDAADDAAGSSDDSSTGQ